MNNFDLEISINYQGFDSSLLPGIKQAVKAVFDFIQSEENYALSFLVCGDEQIQELNKTYRGADRVTDVLSFPNKFQLPDSKVFFLGDVILSYPTALKQAEKYHHAVSHELALLSVHGVLHLLGYDHETVEDEAEMWRIQKTILNNFGVDIALLPGEVYEKE